MVSSRSRPRTSPATRRARSAGRLVRRGGRATYADPRRARWRGRSPASLSSRRASSSLTSSGRRCCRLSGPALRRRSRVDVDDYGFERGPVARLGTRERRAPGSCPRSNSRCTPPASMHGPGGAGVVEHAVGHAQLPVVVVLDRKALALDDVEGPLLQIAWRSRRSTRSSHVGPTWPRSSRCGELVDGGDLMGERCDQWPNESEMIVGCREETNADGEFSIRGRDAAMVAVSGVIEERGLAVAIKVAGPGVEARRDPRARRRRQAVRPTSATGSRRVRGERPARPAHPHAEHWDESTSTSTWWLT